MAQAVEAEGRKKETFNIYKKKEVIVFMKLTKRMPLFIITGASGVGKSTVAEMLFANETKYIVLESDILWNDIYNKPEEDYKEYREIWLNLCSHVSQIGLPVVLCGCATPEQFENCINRKWVSSIHYLAVVSEDSVLEARMRYGRKITDENWVQGSKQFNQWLKGNAKKTTPPITLYDYSTSSASDAAKDIHEWICGILNAQK